MIGTPFNISWKILKLGLDSGVLSMFFSKPNELNDRNYQKKVKQ